MRVRFFIEYDCCRYGCSYKKHTVLTTNSVALKGLNLKCECRGAHEILQGKVKLLAQDGRPEWKWKTSLAAAYPPSLCRSWARAARRAAPRGAERAPGEARLSDAWQDELREDARAGLQRPRFELRPLARCWTAPWAGATATWGTGPSCRCPCSASRRCRLPGLLASSCCPVCRRAAGL